MTTPKSPAPPATDPTPPSGLAPVARSERSRNLGRFLLSAAIAGAFAWLLHAGALPLAPDPKALAGIRGWTVPVYLALSTAGHLIRSARWALLLRPLYPVPLRRVLAVAFIGFAAIVALPLRMGEAVRPMLIRREGELSAWAATGTVGAERVVDGLFLSLLLLLSLELARPVEPLPSHLGSLAVPVSVVPTAAHGAVLLFTVAFLTMGIFYWRRAWATATTERWVGLVSPRLAAWLSVRVGQVADGLGFLSRARISVPFVVATAAYWMCVGTATWLLGIGCGFETMTFPQACSVLGVLALGILIPNAPGFFGAFQLSLYAGLALYFPPHEVIALGSVYVFLAYICQLGVTFGAGAIGLLLERGSFGRAMRATGATPASSQP